MTLGDFRKIAKIPAEAADRIVQKLEFLGKESYTRRAEGIRAFRTSTLMAGYVDVVHAALTGKRKVEDELIARHAQDPQAMTTEEFRALVGLNERIRF